MSKVVRLILFIILVGAVAPARHLENHNGKLYWSDGERAILVESNSPENRLVWKSTAELDTLHQLGVNTIYLSINHSEYALNSHYHLWVDRSNKGLGFNWEEIAAALFFMEYWISLSEENVLHILLSEQENHYDWTDKQHLDFLTMATETFGHLPVIWNREEIRDDRSWLLKWYGILRGLDSRNLIALHNEPGQAPWRHFTGSYSHFLDLVALQSDLGSAAAKMRHAYGFGFAVYASEITPYFEGIRPGDVEQTLQWFTAAGDVSSGAGLYYGLLDQADPQDGALHLLYRDNYLAITNPDLVTVANNRNDLFWRHSQRIGSFDQPAFPDPFTIIGQTAESFGFWETRFWLRPLPPGWHLLEFPELEGNAVLRLRASQEGFTSVSTRVLNGGLSSATLPVYGDQAPWLLSLDVIGAGSARIGDFFLEKEKD